MEIGQRERGGEEVSPLVCSLPEGCSSPLPDLSPLDMMAVLLFEKCRDQFNCLVGMGGAVRDRFLHSELEVVARRYGIVISPALDRRLRVLISESLHDQDGVGRSQDDDGEEAGAVN